MTLESETPEKPAAFIPKGREEGGHRCFLFVPLFPLFSHSHSIFSVINLLPGVGVGKRFI